MKMNTDITFCENCGIGLSSAEQKIFHCKMCGNDWENEEDEQPHNIPKQG